MEWLIAVLVIAVLGLAAIVSSGGLGEMRKEPVSDVYRQDLPDRSLTGEEIETLRFGIAIRGYAMGQVDDVLARLAREIAERDATIATLRAEPADENQDVGEPVRFVPQSGEQEAR